ncbi:hypothetical protein L195_g039609 [Trifolium pratense]|uniref:Uncharacterized protein n=1 Tax=Trifolium pratense TaxID=57577 RepID=A0A2K3LYE8_TRIPR|nr:hypothetical protein L195_g039609 [Trifolium pratense]
MKPIVIDRKINADNMYEMPYTKQAVEIAAAMKNHAFMIVQDPSVPIIPIVCTLYEMELEFMQDRPRVSPFQLGFSGENPMLPESEDPKKYYYWNAGDNAFRQVIRFYSQA